MVKRAVSFLSSIGVGQVLDALTPASPHRPRPPFASHGTSSLQIFFQDLNGLQVMVRDYTSMLSRLM